MKSLSNKFMHLTNYSINKKNEGAYQSNSDETVCQGHKWWVASYFLLVNKNLKICTVFLSSCRNTCTSGSLGEREMLWEHKL